MPLNKENSDVDLNKPEQKYFIEEDKLKDLVAKLSEQKRGRERRPPVQKRDIAKENTDKSFRIS